MISRPRPHDDARTPPPAEREGELRLVEVLDERELISEAALELIASAFAPEDRHPLPALRSEIMEKRLGLLDPYDYHLFVLCDGDRPAAVVAGVYLAGVNAGFITYLVVHSSYRGRKLAQRIRGHLIEAFRADARRSGREDLAWIVGEVQRESLWLRNLVRHGRAVPMDLTYYHPGMTPRISATPYVLYRQPIGDDREVLPMTEARRLLYAVWRRAYRVGYPLQREAFLDMMQQLEGREVVGADPDVVRQARG